MKYRNYINLSKSFQYFLSFSGEIVEMPDISWIST